MLQRLSTKFFQWFRLRPVGELPAQAGFKRISERAEDLRDLTVLGFRPRGRGC